MQIDTYTKMVLTVIALSLVVIASRGVVPSANALPGECGSFENPCTVQVRGSVMTIPKY